MSSTERENHFGGKYQEWRGQLERGKSIWKLLLGWTRCGQYQDVLERGENDKCDESLIPASVDAVNAGAVGLLTMEKRAQAAFRAHKDTLPTSIWHCCSRFFVPIAIDPGILFLFEELRLIYEIAEGLHSNIQRSNLVETRRGGVGGSFVGFAAPSRRESDSMMPATDRQRALRSFASFVLNVLPFLYGREDARVGPDFPRRSSAPKQSVVYLEFVVNFFTDGRRRSFPTSDLS